MDRLSIFNDLIYLASDYRLVFFIDSHGGLHSILRVLVRRVKSPCSHLRVRAESVLTGSIKRTFRVDQNGVTAPLYATIMVVRLRSGLIAFSFCTILEVVRAGWQVFLMSESEIDVNSHWL